MSILKTVSQKISRTTGRTGLVIKKHSPEILMTVGVVGAVTSTVLACKATLKLDAELDIAKERLGKIQEAIDTVAQLEEHGDVSVSYSEEDSKKDKAIILTQTSMAIAKLYAPAVLLGVGSIGCMMGAHRILSKRNVALMAAYAAVEESFKDYRGRVIAELGEEKDRLFANGIARENIEIVNEDGTVTTVESDVYNPDEISQYARFFDESCDQWTKTPEYNLTYVKCQQQYANDLLRSRGHLFLNEVYDMLGIPRSQAGSVVGWVLGEGDDYVDFGIFRDDMSTRDFVNGYERSILLDFNVGGVIYDKI